MSPPSTKLELLVKPRCRREQVDRAADGRVTVAVTAPPVEGRANADVVRVLSRCLGIGRAQVSIVHGAGGRRKLVAVEGLTAEQIASRIAAQAQH